LRIIVAAAGIEADDEAGNADPFRKRLYVVGQVVAAAFLARLDEDDAARVRHLLAVQGVERGQSGKDGVAVVGSAPPVQLVPLDYRSPRTQALAPAGHLRLLVHVPV
jgi:hypothetical protein